MVFVPVLFGLARAGIGARSIMREKAGAALEAARARSLATGNRAVAAGSIGGFDYRRGGTGLKYKGERIRRLIKSADRDALISAMRATNATGGWGKTRVLRALAKLLNVQKKMIRFFERKATPRRDRYELLIYPNEYKIHQLGGKRSGAKFKPTGGGGHVGELRFTAYGKRQVHRAVLKHRQPTGDFYVFLQRKGNRKVFGSWVKRNYIEPVEKKAELLRRWLVEFNRLMARAKTRRRRRR